MTEFVLRKTRLLCVALLLGSCLCLAPMRDAEAAAVSGRAQVSVANANRDGTGTLVDVIMGAEKGTTITRIDVVATGTTTAGMVRLFTVDDAKSFTYLLAEIPVTAVTPSASVKTFTASLNPVPPIVLPKNWKVQASTHNAETFNVYATATNVSLATTGIGQVSTANTARDGTGTLATVLTAGTSGSGMTVSQIDIVATGTTTAGVVRLFLNDGAAVRLYKETLVTAITPSASVAVWSGSVTPNPPIILAPGWKLQASTHNAETFNVTATGSNY